jgi:hypothetical protein
MRRSLRRDLRLLQAYVLVSSLVMIFLAVAALAPQPAATQKIDELTVQRLNVVDANGTLRLVLSNKDRMHPGVMDGITINRPRPVAGLIFFNKVTRWAALPTAEKSGTGSAVPTGSLRSIS